MLSGIGYLYKLLLPLPRLERTTAYNGRWKENHFGTACKPSLYICNRVPRDGTASGMMILEPNRMWPAALRLGSTTGFDLLTSRRHSYPFSNTQTAALHSHPGPIQFPGSMSSPSPPNGRPVAGDRPPCPPAFSHVGWTKVPNRRQQPNQRRRGQTASDPHC